MAKESIGKRILHFSITRIIIGLVACLSVYILTYSLLDKVLFSSDFFGKDISNIIISVVLSIVLLSTYFGIYSWLEKRPITELGTKNLGKSLLWGILIGTIVLSFAILFIYLMGGYTILGINHIFLLTPFIIEIGTAVFEEIIFRGIVFRIVEERLGSWVALIISSLFFGFLHLMNEGSVFSDGLAIAIEAGLLLGAAYMLSRNLWFPIAIHLSWNFAQRSIYGALVSGDAGSNSLIKSNIEGARWFTGGSFGPEGAVQTVVFCVIVAIIMLVMCKRRGLFLRGALFTPKKSLI